MLSGGGLTHVIFIFIFKPSWTPINTEKKSFNTKGVYLTLGDFAVTVFHMVQ